MPFLRTKLVGTAVSPAPATITRCHHAQLDLSYLQAGTTGPPVVMLHGWGAFKELWWSTLRGLGRDHRCFALDFPGHGDTPLGHNDTLSALAETVGLFCDQLGLSAITLMGHSMGGAVALELALRRPELLRHLLLIDAAIDAHLMPSYARIYLVPGFGWAMLRFTQLIGRQIRPIGTRIPHEHGGGWLRPWLRRAAYLAVFEPEGLHRIYRSLFATQVGERLRGLTVPTLVISGQFDGLVPPANSRRLAQLIPGARYIQINGTIHNPMDERPRRFERVVRDFMSALPQ